MNLQNEIPKHFIQNVLCANILSCLISVLTIRQRRHWNEILMKNMETQISNSNIEKIAYFCLLLDENAWDNLGAELSGQSILILRSQVQQLRKPKLRTKYRYTGILRD